MLKGEFDNGKKQHFQFKSIYLIVLLAVDQEKKIIYSNLKRRMEAVGSNKPKGAIELAKVVVELLYSGLLASSTNYIKPGTPNICKIWESDEFEINRNYDFVEEEKTKRATMVLLQRLILSSIPQGQYPYLSCRIEESFR